MDTRNVAISSKELESVIDVLSSAQALQLTRFERIAYRTLMVSVDVAIISFVVFVALFSFLTVNRGATPTPATICLLVFAVSIVVGLISLVLNISLARKAVRENARLKRLGLSSLSRSLWKESRRSRWISRVRGALLFVIGVFILLGIVSRFIAVAGFDYFAAGFVAIIAAVLFGGRYLRNQRERMDLAASAEELKKALENLRRRKDTEVVSVPIRLLERSAQIESAKIAEQRKDAVLESAAFRPHAYAVAFDRGALRERASLGTTDRAELEELVAQLSTDGAQLAAPMQELAGATGSAPQGTIKGQGVEIDYAIDRAKRSIRVNAVRQRKVGAHASVNGTSNA